MNSALKLMRGLGKLKSSFVPATPKPSSTLLMDERIEEQTLPQYCPQLFYPVHLGKVINSRYQIVTKLGYGTSSTVWLAWDNQKYVSGRFSSLITVQSLTLSYRRWWQAPRLVTLKILTRSLDESATAKAELDVSRIITRTNPTCEGRRYLRTVLDSFEVAGPDGTHVALVYEPMRESLSKFQRRLPDSRLPGYFLKPLLAMVLTGIDYLHSECDIIHTGTRITSMQARRA